MEIDWNFILNTGLGVALGGLILGILFLMLMFWERLSR